MRRLAEIVADLEAAHAAMARSLAELVLAVGAFVEAASANQAPPPRQRGQKPQKTHLYQREMRTTGELAQIAGCRYETMWFRLRTRSPEAAVALGAEDRHRDRPERRRPVVERKPARQALTWDRDGRPMTCLELARLAGCTKRTMRDRLRTHSADEAVAMGAADARRRAAPAAAAPADPAPPARRPAESALFEVRASGVAAPAQSSPRVVPRSADPLRHQAPDSEMARLKEPRLAAAVPVFVPDDVKRTVAAPKPDSRFTATGPVPSVFGPPGKYEDTGSAIERWMKGRSR